MMFWRILGLLCSSIWFGGSIIYFLLRWIAYGDLAFGKQDIVDWFVTFGWIPALIVVLAFIYI